MKSILLTAVLLGPAAPASAQQPDTDPDDPSDTEPAPGDPGDPIPEPTQPADPENPAQPETPMSPTDPTPVTTPPPAPPPTPPIVITPPAEPEPVAVDPAPVTVTPVIEQPIYVDRVGVGLTVGAGVSTFMDADTRDFTQPGAGWAARLSIGTREILGLELGYTGTAQEIDALGLDNDAVLVSNGVDAAVRLNLGAETAVQPFLFGGLGWRHYNVTNVDTNTSSINEEDDVLEFPVGAGLGFRAGGLNMELRTTFRPASDSDLIGGRDRIDEPGDLPDDLDPDDIDDPAARDSKSTLHNWSATLGAGWEF
jgi:hypothetical protein